MINKIRIGLLSKQRGNYKLQQKFAGEENVLDTTPEEVAHHEESLLEAGYAVEVIEWNSSFISRVKKANVDLIFNVSCLVEAAILEELEIPFVGSGTSAIALSSDKSLAKRLWQEAGIPTSEFAVLHDMAECRQFINTPSIPYPLFTKPVAGRGSSGISSQSLIKDDDQLMRIVEELLKTIGQPVLVERFLEGREITIGLIGNGDQIRTLPPLEIVYGSGAQFLTFDKKEMEKDTFICPAKLTGNEMEQLIRYATSAFKLLGLRDYARIDTILTPKGFMLLESNTFAGLMCTPKEKPFSYIGFMARAEKKGGKELIGEIISVALERINHKKG